MFRRFAKWLEIDPGTLFCLITITLMLTFLVLTLVFDSVTCGILTAVFWFMGIFALGRVRTLETGRERHHVEGR